MHAPTIPAHHEGNGFDLLFLVQILKSFLFYTRLVSSNRLVEEKAGHLYAVCLCLVRKPAATQGLQHQRGRGAESAVTVMFLHIRRVLNVCPSACSHHSQIIRSLLGELAEKNLRLNEKLTHMGQRTTRAKLLSYFPARCSAGAAMNSTFRSPASSLRIISAWSAADCLWSLEKCGMRACSTFTKAISFSKRRRLTVPFLLRVKEPPLGVLASADNPRQPRSVGVLQMEEAATGCRDRQDSVSSYNLIIFCLNSKRFAELKEPNRTTGAAPRRFSQII